eukprot:Selendium_serpulae@DN11658_c0_g1_i1.p1
MDIQVPNLMGVRKAILENVVFCHQEDSNWPLQDMKQLKKRFDDLFGSARYTKALENINKLRQDHGKVLKDKLHELEIARISVDEFENVKGRLAKCENKADGLKAKIDALRDERVALARTAEAAASRYAAVESFDRDLAFKDVMIQQLQSEVTKLKSEMDKDGVDLFTESEDVLRASMPQLQTDIAKMEVDVTETDELVARCETAIGKVTQSKENAMKESEESIRIEERLALARRRRRELLLHFAAASSQTAGVGLDENGDAQQEEMLKEAMSSRLAELEAQRES